MQLAPLKIPDHFHHPKRRPHNVFNSHSPSPRLLGNHESTLCLCGFACFGRFAEWSHTLCGLLCLASLTETVLSGSIPEVASVSTLLLFVADSQPRVWMDVLCAHFLLWAPSSLLFLPLLFPGCLRVPELQGCSMQNAHPAGPRGRGSTKTLFGATSWGLGVEGSGSGMISLLGALPRLSCRRCSGCPLGAQVLDASVQW